MLCHAFCAWHIVDIACDLLQQVCCFELKPAYPPEAANCSSLCGNHEANPSVPLCGNLRDVLHSRLLEPFFDKSEVDPMSHSPRRIIWGCGPSFLAFGDRRF